MRLELWMILITGAVIFHIYTDGKYTKNLMMYKKYFKMGGVVIAAFIFYVLLKKNPANAENIIKTSNDYIKYLPIDKNTTSMISPILDFTSKHRYNNDTTFPVVRVPNEHTRSQSIMMNSGKKGTKSSHIIYTFITS